MPSTTYSSSRRNFLQTSSLAAASVFMPSILSPIFAQTASTRKFTLCINPGNIGVKATQKELLQMAIQHGYESMSPMPDQLMAFSETERADFVGQMKAKNISWDSTNITVDFRKDERTFRDGLAQLPQYAAVLEKVGATRMNTWISNAHPDLTYSANFKQHADRLRASAKVLGHYGVRLGLEYVGPKTSMIRRKYPFMRTMAEARELIAAIGEPNVGLVLDSFHWYCAEDTIDDILALDKSDIVTCDINDARADLSRDEQIDGTRELPGATGVIDLKAFLGALVQIGYDGPVRSEPFNQVLRDMDDQEALKVNYQAMKKSFALVE
ncbi:MAG: sugar phosphate isomerase/epimerase family protein [Bacteroidia bacterium]|nr:sugar phosphate isomerase/epimerase family protein [Bacteroidia bacterium]